MGKIVVGFDGSKGSEGALRFAVEEARLRGAALKVVCAWTSSDTAYAGLGYIPVDTMVNEEQATAPTFQKARDLLGSDSGVTFELTAMHGQAADSLLAEASDAEMIVVGSRGLGGVKGLLLGSISQQVAQRATCPVVIVPNRAS